MQYCKNENDGSKNIISSKCDENYFLTKVDYALIIRIIYFQKIVENIPYCNNCSYKYINDNEVITKCIFCKNGYFLNENWTCDYFGPENCSLSSIILNKIQ